MKVLKFGGTSVGTVESLRNVKAIVESQTEPVIVVVSALGGITDQLINTARLAAQGDIAYLESYARIVDRHHKVIDGIVPEQSRLDVQSIVSPLLEELGNIYRGVNLIKDLSDRTLDIIVSYGERLSSVIISRIIDGAIHLDSRNFIKTEKQWNKHVLDNESTQRRVHEVFDDLKFKVALVPGFIASDRDGNVTNLGRGGSDYTAAILAAALDAAVLEIWTDVDGFMTADPRVINGALVIDHLSFTEAMELCNFGAKVIYPPTIYPVFHKNIPIWIKNTFNPEAPGTCISEQHPSPEGKAIKGISSINDTCLITVQGLGMVGVIGINSRIFNTLAKNGISVFLVSQAASENNTSFAVRNADADHAIEVLREQFAPELQAGSLSDIIAEPNLATVAIVGENMKHTTGIAGKLFNTLGRNGISVIACAQGASETNISFVIEHNNLRKALRLRLVGIANSRKCVFDRDGIDTENYNERLEASDIVATPENIRNGVIGMNIFNSVFVDCTSSPDIAALYADLLDHNINVVAANKIAASGKYEDYSRLKHITRKKDVKFLFETNVGAGLPIINTINNLINSGDRILKIEAVVSGTLNYIFNVLSRDVPMSRAIKMSQEAGYSEPDPRTDLSGKDVIRKLVILAREAGYKVEQEDVKASLFIPDKYFSGSLDDFYRDITGLDGDFERQRAEAEKAGEHFRFVARLDNGVTSVGLQKVDSVHPFYHLEGSNNVILITTERYNEYPMVIKGYGAGAEVTAAGVFSDIIGIANIR